MYNYNIVTFIVCFQSPVLSMEFNWGGQFPDFATFLLEHSYACLLLCTFKKIKTKKLLKREKGIALCFIIVLEVLFLEIPGGRNGLFQNLPVADDDTDIIAALLNFALVVYPSFLHQHCYMLQWGVIFSAFYLDKT